MVTGGVELAMKRATLFGRAPVLADLEVAFTLWGFLGDTADPELVAFRRTVFAQVSHHYADRRDLVDMVDEDVLRRPLGEVRSSVTSNWRSVLHAPALTGRRRGTMG